MRHVTSVTAFLLLLRRINLTAFNRSFLILSRLVVEWNWHGFDGLGGRIHR